MGRLGAQYRNAMYQACQVAGCERTACLFVKSYAVCSAHGDQVIDRLRETGLSVHAASIATVQSIMLRLAATT